MGVASARSVNATECADQRSHRRYDRRVCCVGWQRKVVTWLLLMVIAEANGELTVQVLSDHKTMAECHVAGTKIQWEERMPVNKEMLCFATDIKVTQ